MSFLKRPLALILIFGATFGAGPVLAGDDDLSYPELLVTPSATSRLDMEAKAETENNWAATRPLQIPAAMTFLSGLYLAAENPNKELVNGVNPAKTASMVAMGVGAGWLATSYFLAEKYTPYSDGQREVKALPSNTQKEKLARERIAEEALAKPARLGRNLNWLAIITNVGASIMVTGNGGQYSTILGGISAAVAFTPFLFPYHWQDVYNQHLDYKKRIYGPIAMNAIYTDKMGTLYPGVAFAWQF